MEHHTIDRVKYDHCVRMDKLGLPYGFSWYLDTVAEKWDALVLNDYDAVWPLPVRNKFGFRYFYRPFAVQQLGIFSKTGLDESLQEEFVSAMQRHCSFADVYMNEGQFSHGLLKANVQVEPNTNYTLPLQTSYRELYHGYKGNTKRNVKKANNGKLSIFENDSPSVILNLFRNEKGSQLALSENFYRSMEKAMFQCLHKGLGKIWTVYGDGNSVYAGAFFVETDRRATLLFTTLTPQGRDKHAMYHLLNEYIILGSEKPVLLDFEGSNLKSLARFYAGFGSTKVSYPRLKYNGLPVPFKWLKRK